jgi:hypothetical protein
VTPAETEIRSRPDDVGDTEVSIETDAPAVTCGLSTQVIDWHVSASEVASRLGQPWDM